MQARYCALVYLLSHGYKPGVILYFGYVEGSSLHFIEKRNNFYLSKFLKVTLIFATFAILEK